MVNKVNFLSEKELLLSIADGDEKAFELILNKYSDVLGSYIYKLTHSREIAEEIVQDAFLKLWTNREALRNIKNFHAWLYTVSKNQAINAVRKLIKEKAGITALSQNINFYENHTSDWEDDKLNILEKAITRLPPQQKKVYLLNKKGGYSYKEIASQMQISTETVKKYLQYATRSILSEVESISKIGLLIAILKNL